MLQRIQTVFLAIAALATLVFLFVEDIETFGNAHTILQVALAIVALLEFLNIFNYKNRPRQILLNTAALVANILLIGLLAYRLLTLSGGKSFPEKGIELLLPAVSVVMLALANIYTRRDQRLVKSVDRLR